MSNTQEKHQHKWRAYGQQDGIVVCDECSCGADVNKLIKSAKREAAIEQVMRDEMTLGLELPITDEQQLIGWRNDTIAELKALKEGKQ